MLVLGSVRYLVPAEASADTVTAVGLVISVTTGVLLGAATAGAWSAATDRWALPAGAWAAFLVAPVVGSQVPVAWMRWPVPQWLFAVALVALVAAMSTTRPGARAQRIDGRALIVAVVAACVLTAGYVLLGDLVRSESAAGAVRMWLVAAAALVATVIGAEVTARFLPLADDRFPIAVTGVVAAAYPLAVELRAATVWVLLVAPAAAVAGVLLARRLPYPGAGLAVAFVTSTVAVLWPATFADHIPLPVRVALVAVGTGLALGASLPGTATTAALGMSLLAPAAAVSGAVWALPADPRWVVTALAVTAAACAWQLR
ncbi:hypothetical protein [Rhodococcus chondri]|uniref:Integral membrane protein n=1 Tax=Rhodococcus chondri TaxID=3065941 RepID=A0ABU7JLW3_9NOCA|nr:hypothetical protein [Rhodococcus sp. CC-R104]MEE2031025.1 hypothetical protein [Rhodococcus sp. CC-R104]